MYDARIHIYIPGILTKNSSTKFIVPSGIYIYSYIFILQYRIIYVVCKVEFQPFNRSYSYMTFFSFHKIFILVLLYGVIFAISFIYVVCLEGVIEVLS